MTAGPGAPPDDDAPVLTVDRWRDDDHAVALLLHGGTEVSTAPVDRWSGPALRMVPFGWAIRRRGAGVATVRLRFRCRGWNGAAADPVADVEHALARIGARRPGIPIVLVGHSMGGRAAIRAAGHHDVRGIVALAPWIPAEDPVRQLADRDVVVLHGTDDRRTSPLASARFARAAEGVARSVEYVAIPGGDHAMLRGFRRWHTSTAAAVHRIAARDGTAPSARPPA